MVRLLIHFFCAVLALIGTPALAAPIIFTGTGTVTAVTPVSAEPTGSIVLGGSLSFRFRFDPDASSLLFDGGASLQVFAQPISFDHVRIGGYDFMPFTDPSSPPVVLLSEGFRLLPGDTASSAVSTQSIILPGTAAGNLPFPITATGGTTLSLDSTFRHDPTGVAPTIADLRDPNGAAINRFFLTVGDENGIIGTVAGDFTATFASAVPESSTWLLLIVGFGAIGARMRGRNGGRAGHYDLAAGASAP